MKRFLANALFLPMTPDDYAKPSIIQPKIILGLTIILASLPIWWLMPADTRDVSLWRFVGGVITDVIGGFFILAAIQIAADRSALQPGTGLNRLDTRLKRMFAREEIDPQHQEPAPCQSIPDEPLAARVASYLAEVDCAFEQSDPPGMFQVEAVGKHGSLRLTLMARQEEEIERFVVMARYPVILDSSCQQAMAVLLNQINARLAVGSLELNEGSVYVRYSLDWDGAIPKSAFNSAIARTISIADACYVEIVSVLSDEPEGEFAANIRPVDRAVTLH
jgi:hypothetical protein